METTFGFTNKTASTHTITPVNIDPVSVYAKTEDTATSCALKNKTAPLSQGELLSYQCTEINSVSTKQNIVNPAKTTAGVQYIVRLDEILRTTDPNGDYIVDEPIVMYLTVRHPNSSYITASHIAEVFTRLCGALQRDDGTYRFDDLMLSALAPVAN